MILFLVSFAVKRVRVRRSSQHIFIHRYVLHGSKTRYTIH